LSTYSKKKEQQITFFMQISFVVAALAGWFIIGSIVGMVSSLLIWFSVLIFITLIRKRRLQKLLDETGVGKIDFMDNKEFERYLMNFFKEENYTVTHTPATFKQGATFILNKDDEAIAVFSHASDRPIDGRAIQQIIQVLPKYQDRKIWAITNYQFNAEAVGLALQNSITPLDREDLLERFLSHKKN